MHELGIVTEVVDVVSERAAGRRVTRVVLEIGRLTAVVPDSVRFCFDLVAEGTSVEGAALEIIETTGRGHCNVCGADVDLDVPFGVCGCGAADLDVIGGHELKIRAMEVM